MPKTFFILCPHHPSTVQEGGYRLIDALRKAREFARHHDGKNCQIWVAGAEGDAADGEPVLWNSDGRVIGRKNVDPPPIRGVYQGHTFEIHTPVQGNPYMLAENIETEFDIENHKVIHRDADSGAIIKVVTIP